MKILKTITDIDSSLNKSQNIIGFVPTMGALHKGHISLIEKSKHDNDITIVSIFVNPTQFLIGEDFIKYPSKNNIDIEILQSLDVDYLFLPDISQLYKNDEVLIKAPKLRSYILEGENRPTHFDGVLQIVLKLFNIIRPTNAYFGKKDAQQLILIKQMVKDLFLRINIQECDIVRDNDGLALSSRNIYLSLSDRKLALNISKALFCANDMISNNEMNSTLIIKKIKNILCKVNIEYIAIVNYNLEPLNYVEINNTIILIAVKIGNTRLIDNLWL